MLCGQTLRGTSRLLAAMALAMAPVTAARAMTAFEYRAAGLSISVDVPDGAQPGALSNVVAVSGAKTPERLLVPADPVGRWRVLLTTALVPGFAPYGAAVGVVDGAENAREQAADASGGSLVISYRAPDGQIGLQLRVGASGTLRLSYDRPDRDPPRWRNGSGVLPVAGIAYMTDAPATVPLPPAAPLLGAALLALFLRRRRA